MYKRRTPGAKRDPARQWALPDRVFFAAGACHMLAYAFIERYPHNGFEAAWIRPTSCHTGNHIVVVRDDGCSVRLSRVFGLVAVLDAYRAPRQPVVARMVRRRRAHPCRGPGLASPRPRIRRSVDERAAGIPARSIGTRAATCRHFGAAGRQLSSSAPGRSHAALMR